MKDQRFHLAKNLAIPAFRDTEWDGLVGLGFTMKGKVDKSFGMSILDKLLFMNECKEKIFSYYIEGEGGKVDFCDRPKNIKNFDKEVYWAPIYEHFVENPWGI